MDWYLWLGALLLFAVAAAGLFTAFRSPMFVGGLIAVLAEQMFGPVLKGLAPRNMTPAEIEMRREGLDPFQPGRRK